MELNRVNDEKPAVKRNLAADTTTTTLLVKAKSFEALGTFLGQLPDTLQYNNDENIIRARIHLALHLEDTKTVYKLIEDSTFKSGEDLIKIWDEARYLDEEKRTKKQLTPLSRFRVRKRYPPPSSVCVNGVRKTNTLPREATGCLKMWLINHLNDPYPTASEKQQLAKMSGLSQAQVKTWFANARRRSKNTDEFQRKCKNHWSKPMAECSSIMSPPSSPLPLPYPSNHNSHFMFGEEQMPYLENNGPFGGSYQDYIQALSHGFNRQERSHEYSYDHHLYSFCNNLRFYRAPAEQCDASGRFIYDVPRNHHHYELLQPLATSARMSLACDEWLRD